MVEDRVRPRSEKRVDRRLIQRSWVEPWRRPTYLDQIPQDLPDLFRLGDDGENAHRGTTSAAGQWIDLIHLGYQPSPGGIYIYWFRNSFAISALQTVITIEILVLPLFRIIISFRISDTYWGVIAPFIASPFIIFFFRQYVIGIPKDFIDAARVDGVSEFGIYLRIMSPLMTPAYAAMAILQARQTWNDFFWPLVVLRSEKNLTLQIGLASLLTPYGSNYDLLLTGSVLATIPIIVLFILFQRYFISGILAGGIKG